MSNIFIWVRNPTIINGLATTYVDKRGSDTFGDGTAQNPYASIEKTTSVAANGSNIMLGDGEWEGSVQNNNKSFRFFGNGMSKITFGAVAGQINPYNSAFYFLECKTINVWVGYNGATFVNCFLHNLKKGGNTHIWVKNCICIDCDFGYGAKANSVFFNCTVVVQPRNYWLPLDFFYDSINNIFYNCNVSGADGDFPDAKFDYNNFCDKTILSYKNVHSINDTITGQTFADYFNYYDSTDWLKCDFTAKEGSKNIGAGEKGSTIGLNQGFSARADGTANDVFSSANGATLRNVAFDSNLGGYILQQKDRVCSGATANTITFDNDASSENDYYKGLFVGITSGVGEQQIRYITDYNGATKTATLSQAWDVVPDTENKYSISGKIDSAVKDFGKAIKVKRNFTFVDNMTVLPNGQWAEFLTAANAQNEIKPVSCFQWEYSVDGSNWRSGTELVSATDGNTAVDSFVIGDASESYDETKAEFPVFRYVRFHIHIVFNIDNYIEA